MFWESCKKILPKRVTRKKSCYNYSEIKLPKNQKEAMHKCPKRMVYSLPETKGADPARSGREGLLLGIR